MAYLRQPETWFNIGQGISIKRKTNPQSENFGGGSFSGCLCCPISIGSLKTNQRCFYINVLYQPPMALLVFQAAAARARVVAMDGDATRFKRIGEELFVFFGGVGGVKCTIFHV